MKFVAALALAALTVLVWAESIVLSKNYLLHNQNWIVGKQMSIGPMTGASQTVTSRSVLAGYQMNFASYGAFQELESRRLEALDRVDFRLHLSPGAIFDIFYSEREGERAGLRLSNNRAFPGRVYRMRDYQFSWSELRPELEVAPGWHDISIRSDAGGPWIFIDGSPRMALPGGQLSSAFGLRSGKEKVLLTKVETYHGGKLVWKDGFRLGRIWGAAAERAVFILAITLLAIFVAFRRWRAVELSLRYALAFSLLWLTFDYFYYSFLPTSRTRLGSYLVHPTISYFNFEDLRLKFFDSLLNFPGDSRLDLLGLPPYPPQIIDLHPLLCVNRECRIDSEDTRFPPKAAHEKRMLMVGGSMLRAQGVKHPEDVFFYNLAKLTQDRLGAEHFTAINLARSDEIQDQVRLFFERYKEFQPDILVASFLGIWNETQERALRQLIEYCRDNKIVFLYMVAPMNREFGSGPTTGLDWIKKTYGVPALDLNLALSDELRHNTGILWWDATHLTDYGNRRIFDFSRPFIERSLPVLSNQGSAAREEIPSN